MKWVKQPYFPKAGTHRNGWTFWDLLDGEGKSLCFIRYVPSEHKALEYQTFANNRAEDFRALNAKHFDTLKEAQDFCVAHFVLKKLEDT